MLGVCVAESSLGEFGGPTSAKLLPGPVRVAYTSSLDGRGLWALVRVSDAVASLSAFTHDGPAETHRLRAGFYLVWTSQSYVGAFDSPANFRKRIVIGEVVGFNRQGLEVGSDQLFACGKLNLDAGGDRGLAENAPVCPSA